jgi:acyl carrier protein
MITETDIRNALQETMGNDAAKSWSRDFNFREGALDSLDQVTVLLALQERHGLSFKDSDVPRLNTIHAILDYATEQGR